MNEPAFPTPDGGFIGWSSNKGMTLRDYFAAKAMQGTLVSQSEFDECGIGVVSSIARYAYEMADAMLKEREKSNGA